MTTATVSPWSLIHKALFRFATVYFGVYVCCSMILVGDGSPLDELWKVPVTWAGRWLIGPGYSIEIMPNGSGDTTFNYLQILSLAVIAAIASVIWGIADRKRPDYRKLQYWLMVLLRYTLAITMLSYGMVKIIKLQFPYPYLFQLETCPPWGLRGLTWAIPADTISLPVLLSAWLAYCCFSAEPGYWVHCCVWVLWRM